MILREVLMKTLSATCPFRLLCFTSPAIINWVFIVITRSQLQPSSAILWRIFAFTTACPACTLLYSGCQIIGWKTTKDDVETTAAFVVREDKPATTTRVHD